MNKNGILIVSNDLNYIIVSQNKITELVHKTFNDLIVLPKNSLDSNIRISADGKRLVDINKVRYPVDISETKLGFECSINWMEKE